MFMARKVSFLFLAQLRHLREEIIDFRIFPSVFLL